MKSLPTVLTVEKKITSYLSSISDFDTRQQVFEIKKCFIQYFHRSDRYYIFLLKILLLDLLDIFHLKISVCV